MISLWITAYSKEPSLFVFIASEVNKTLLTWHIKGDKNWINFYCNFWAFFSACSCPFFFKSLLSPHPTPITWLVLLPQCFASWWLNIREVLLRAGVGGLYMYLLSGFQTLHVMYQKEACQFFTSYKLQLSCLLSVLTCLWVICHHIICCFKAVTLQNLP